MDVFHEVSKVEKPESCISNPGTRGNCIIEHEYRLLQAWWQKKQKKDTVLGDERGGKVIVAKAQLPFLYFSIVVNLTARQQRVSIHK